MLFILSIVTHVYYLLVRNLNLLVLEVTRQPTDGPA